MSLVKRVSLIMTLGLGALYSPFIWAELLPLRDFLVVTSSRDTLGDYHAQFTDALITSSAFRELVSAMNPTANIRGVGLKEELISGQVLTLPGQQTLKRLSTTKKAGVDSASPAAVLFEQQPIAHDNASAGKVLQDDPLHRSNNVSRSGMPSQNSQYSARQTQTHTVSYGDTLWGLAFRYGIDMLELAQMNNLLAPYRLFTGQTLVIGIKDPGIKLPRSGMPSQNSQHSARQIQTHTVSYGDTLWGLAYRYGIDMLELAQMNNLPAPYRLFTGQTLVIGIEDPSINPSMSAIVGTTPSAVQSTSWTKSSGSQASKSDRASVRSREGDNAQSPFFSGYEQAGNQTERAYLIKEEARPDATSHSGLPDSDHLHELLLPSAFVMFCMTEENSQAVLADVRETFDGMLSANMADESYIPITRYLKDLGYLRANIHSDQGGRAMFLASGPRFRVASLEIGAGQAAVKAHGRHPQLSISVNQVYSPQVEQQLSNLAEAWLADQGYPLVNVSDLQMQFDDERAEVKFHFSYDASRNIQVTAVDQTSANALTRGQLRTLSPFSEDPRYSQLALEQFRSRLMATGLYKSVVFELLADDDAGEDHYNIEVSTAASNTKRLGANVGYSQGRGPLLQAGLTLPNMTGREDDILIRASADDVEQQIGIAYQRRNLFKYGVDVGLSGNINQQDQPYFSSEGSGLSLRGSWHGSDRQNGRSWHVSLDWRKADERRLGAVMDKRFEYGGAAIEHFGRGTGVLDFFSDYSLTFEHAISLTANADSYWSAKAAGDWVLPELFGRRFDGRLGADIRYADNLSSLPFSAQLYSGGVGNNRGYEAATFSSLELDPESTAFLVYGQIEMPMEVNFDSPWLSKVIPFMDLSMLGADGNKANQTFSSIGVGLAAKAAGHPYRIDLAVPVGGRVGKGLMVNFNTSLD